jgi:hypothetical protein
MSVQTEQFAALIFCANSMPSNKYRQYLRDVLKVDYIDLLVEPKADESCLRLDDKTVWVNIKDKLLLSIKKHKTSLLVLAGSTNKAGERGALSTDSWLAAMAKKIQEWKLPIRVLGLKQSANQSIETVASL